MYKVIEIEKYEFTRDVIVESQNSKRIYRVFDDSDIIGTAQFTFVKEQAVYDCKIGIMGDEDPSGELFDVLSREKIGKMDLFKISNSSGDNFYFPVIEHVNIGSQIKLDVGRYDLLAVDNVINDRTI